MHLNLKLTLATSEGKVKIFIIKDKYFLFWAIPLLDRDGKEEAETAKSWTVLLYWETMAVLFSEVIRHPQTKASMKPNTGLSATQSCQPHKFAYETEFKV